MIVRWIIFQQYFRYAEQVRDICDDWRVDWTLSPFLIVDLLFEC